ncbi:ATP-binding protein [Streptomyces albulus]|nr:ATP-binding protein [Streptomyces noursei]
MDEGTVLVGRETELATIVGFLDAIAARGRSCVFVGEPGIGKTALLAAAADEARARGLAVLSARGAESERHLSFAGLHSLLYPVRACLDRLEPVHQEALRGVFGLSQAPVELFLVALAALELLAEAAEQRPLLLLVDDLHWLDAASRDVIEFVARRLDSEPLVLLAASRPHRAVTGQSLDALGPDASRTLLRRRVDLPPDLEDKVLDEAAGNPLALLELPVALRSQGIQGGALPLTARLETAFAARLAELDERPRLLLLLAAVNDGELLAEAVAAAANLAGSDVAARDAEQAVRLHLAATDGTTVTFRHPLVRSAVLQTASETERRRAHQSLAQVLTGFPDRYAWHLAAASDGPDEDLARLLDQAADRALRRGAPRRPRPGWNAPPTCRRPRRAGATDCCGPPRSPSSSAVPGPCTATWSGSRRPCWTRPTEAHWPGYRERSSTGSPATPRSCGSWPRRPDRRWTTGSPRSPPTCCRGRRPAAGGSNPAGRSAPTCWP